MASYIPDYRIGIHSFLYTFNVLLNHLVSFYVYLNVVSLTIEDFFSLSQFILLVLGWDQSNTVLCLKMMLVHLRSLRNSI